MVVLVTRVNKVMYGIYSQGYENIARTGTMVLDQGCVDKDAPPPWPRRMLSTLKLWSREKEAWITEHMQRPNAENGARSTEGRSGCKKSSATFPKRSLSRGDGRVCLREEPISGSVAFLACQLAATPSPSPCLCLWSLSCRLSGGHLLKIPDWSRCRCVNKLYHSLSL